MRATPTASRVRLRTLLRVASIASGIQFGWALQLSLLTPFVQELGIPDSFRMPGQVLSGFAARFPDSSFSRSLVTSVTAAPAESAAVAPFILVGATSIIVSVCIIGFSADIGYLRGDRGHNKIRGVVAYVIGFWMLDVAYNMTQGPCRALHADLAGWDHRRTRVANAYFSLFNAVGNILGYATGSYSKWFKIFRFTRTSACSVNCANLKSAFLIDIIFILVTTVISLSAALEQPYTSFCSGEEPGNSEQEAFLWEFFRTFRYFAGTVWVVLLVTALTSIGWFPIVLFDTDWMGREIYGGKPNEGLHYSTGVRMGSLGLMLNSVLLGVTSVLMEKLCKKLGAGLTWGLANILVCLCFVGMLIIAAINSSSEQ